MAYSTQTAPETHGFSIRSVFAPVLSTLAGVYDSFARAAAANSTAQQRIDKIARLQTKSDAELARMGLKRDDIVHHVFRDLFWQ